MITKHKHRETSILSNFCSMLQRLNLKAPFIWKGRVDKPARLTIVPDCQIRYKKTVTQWNCLNLPWFNMLSCTIIRKICSLWELCEPRQRNFKKKSKRWKNAKCCAIKAASQLFYTSYCHLSWTHCKKLLSQKFSTLSFFFFASDGWHMVGDKNHKEEKIA